MIKQVVDDNSRLEETVEKLCVQCGIKAKSRELQQSTSCSVESRISRTGMIQVCYYDLDLYVGVE